MNTTWFRPATLIAEIEDKEREVVLRQKQLKSLFSVFEEHLELRRQRLLGRVTSPVSLALAFGTGFIIERFTRFKSRKVEIVHKTADGRKPKAKETFVAKILKVAAVVRSVSGSFSYAWQRLASVFGSFGKPGFSKPPVRRPHIKPAPAGKPTDTLEPADTMEPKVKPDQPALLQPTDKIKPSHPPRGSV